MVYDICVVGSGPGGAILLNILKNSSLKIALIEKRDFSKEYDFNSNNLKSCGGLLSPKAQYMLAKLNLNLPKEILVEPQIFKVKTIDFESNLVKNYQRFYLNLNREKFDRWLSNMSDDSSIDKYYRTRVQSIKKENEMHTLNIFNNKNEKEEIKAKIVIGADGATSVVRKLFENPSITKYASIQKVYHKKNIPADFIAIFDSNITDYYGWGLVKDDYFYLGVATKFKDNARQKFDEMKNELKAYGYEPGKEIRTEGTMIFRPKLSEIRTATEDSLTYLIGESAGFISPSFAEGFSFAIESAIALGESILEIGNVDNPNEVKKIYSKKTKKIKMRILIKKLKAKLLHNKYIRKIAMKSGIQSIK